MTEAELIESVMAVGEAVGYSVALYLTTVSSYLVAAYFIGSDLNRLQIITINVLFLVFALSFVMSIQVNLDNMLSLGEELQNIRPDWNRFASPITNKILLIVDLGGIAVSLFFMWNIRHPKK